MDRKNWPWWIRLSLLGIKTRRAALMWCGASILLGLGAAIYFKDAGWLWVWIAAILYYVPLKWVDRNGSWS